MRDGPKSLFDDPLEPVIHDEVPVTDNEMPVEHIKMSEEFLAVWRSWDPSDVSAIIDAKGESDHWRELTNRLKHLISRMFEKAAAYQQGFTISASWGHEIVERLDRCEALLREADMRDALVKQQHEVSRFVTRTRAVAETFMKLGSEPGAT